MKFVSCALLRVTSRSYEVSAYSVYASSSCAPFGEITGGSEGLCLLELSLSLAKHVLKRLKHLRAMEGKLP